MDDELKWFFCVIGLMIVGGCIAGITAEYCNHLETLKAMENGYIQQVDPDTHKLIWIKENNNE